MAENKETKENKIITETEEKTEAVRLIEGVGNVTKPDIKVTVQKLNKSDSNKPVEKILARGTIGLKTQTDIKVQMQKPSGNEKTDKGLGGTTNPDIKPTSEPAKPVESSSSIDNQQSSSSDKK